MKPIKIEAYKMNYKLAEPISISFNTWTHQENILVKLKYEKFEGLGEAAPFKPITLDSQEDVLNELRRLKEIKLDPQKTSWQDFHNYLNKKITGHTTRAALDFAFHDLKGKIENKPVYKLYTNKLNLTPNSVTIFCGKKEKMQLDAKKIISKYPHLKIIKIKLMGNEDDLEKIKAIKKISPSNLTFMVDANQGFDNDPKKAVRILNEMAKILKKVLLVEEPLKKGNLNGLKYVKENVKKWLVFADESAVDVEDAKKVIEQKVAHGINIKLQKAGGIWQGKLMAKMAEKAGLKVMVGCMLEGPLAISASINFAVSTPNVIMTDLDMDFPMSPHTKNICSFKNGIREPLELMGLGIKFDQEKINSLVKKGKLVWQKII